MAKKKKAGRPKGVKSKGSINLTKEDTLYSILSEYFNWLYMNEAYPVNKIFEIVFNENFSKDKTSRNIYGEILSDECNRMIYVWGLLHGAEFVKDKVIPKFLLANIKHMSLYSFAKREVMVENVFNVLQRKDFKRSEYIPSSMFRKAKFKFNVEKFGKITERERIAVLDKERNDGKTFTQISDETRIPIEKVEEIINRAIKQKRHISTPYRIIEGKKEKVLILNAEKSYKNRDAENSINTSNVKLRK
jgi:hypothetical protein